MAWSVGLISKVMNRCPLGNVVGEGNAGWFSPPFPVWRRAGESVAAGPFPFTNLSEYLGAYVLDHNPEAGCVEQARQIRLQ
jgi:hypothetical protein